MKINELFKNKKVVFSMEVFPPNKKATKEAVQNATREICKLNPDYVSVTYGAGGINTEQSPTLEIAQFIKEECKTLPLAHLTCVNSKKQQVLQVLDGLEKIGLENVLALRGDKNPELSDSDEFEYASELVQLIRCKSDFNISGACYPEGHTECESIEKDIDNLKYKIDSGVNHLITQLFFDN
ncbi:MAG: methylenetetrahydrofolate reductase, partial [Oscillospiraceae bacterium]